MIRTEGIDLPEGKGFHPKSSTLMLYTKRKEGGRGLVSVKATVQDETSKIREYIKKNGPDG